MPRSLLPFALLVAAGPALAAEKPPVLDLWSGKPPGVTAATGEEKDTSGPKGRPVASQPVIRLGNVSRPTLTLYRPAKEKDAGAAAIVCPGGGYNILAWDLEGTEVCKWLNDLGVTAVLLKYRVPKAKSDPRNLPALMDAQRAIRLTRANAREWGIDPKKIGILGFSAGGHLSAAASTNFDKPSYEAIDKTDELSCRPDFTVLIYPAYLINAKKDALAEDIRVGKETPPTFLVHAGDDNLSSENSVQMYLALKHHRVRAELHIYDRGGHGYGLRRTEHPVTGWPKPCEEWLRQQGVIGK